MDPIRKTGRLPRFNRLFELIRQGDMAEAMANRPVTHGAAHSSEMLVFQVAAAQSLSAEPRR